TPHMKRIDPKVCVIPPVRRALPLLGSGVVNQDGVVSAALAVQWHGKETVNAEDRAARYEIQPQRIPAFPVNSVYDRLDRHGERGPLRCDMVLHGLRKLVKQGRL